MAEQNTEPNKGKGPLLAAIVIAIIILLAAIYIWYATSGAGVKTPGASSTINTTVAPQSSATSSVVPSSPPSLPTG